LLFRQWRAGADRVGPSGRESEEARVPRGLAPRRKRGAKPR
jgi:hypothetical protein